MSMQSVLGVVGGVIGSFFGYPQLGFVVGSLVGGLLTPKEKTEGPRLDDLKVQVSTYGAGIPVLYGTERIGGNVVWSTDKIETSTTEEAGKGGGAEHKSYRYFVHMRIALCETPRDGSTVDIVQIFQDGKLKWDARSGIPIASALASEENLFAFFTLYQGDAAQLPDPVEEIYAGGAGTVPAYRGIVSISMKAIECPGGRVPQFSFVLSTGAVAEPEIEFGDEFTLPTYVKATASRVTTADPVTLFLEQDVGTEPNRHKLIYVYAMGADYLNQVGTIDTSIAHNYTAIQCISDIDMLCVRDVLGTTGVDSELNRVYLPDGSSKTFAPDFKAYGQSSSRCAKWGNRFVITGDTNQGTTDARVFEWDSGAPVSFFASLGAEVILLTSSYVWVLKSSTLYVYGTEDFALVTSQALPVGMSGHDVRFTPQDSDQLLCFSNNAPGQNNCDLWRVQIAGLTIVFTVLKSSSSFRVDDITSDAITVGGTAGLTVIIVQGTDIEDRKLSYIRWDALTLESYLAKDIIADQCERAGETRYDVSGIPDGDVIHGYKIQNPASARSNIDPLLTAFAIYIVDEDGLIKFKKYEDITSEATISYDELGQAEDGAEPSDAMPLSRTQEIDLPRSVTVSYVEESFDYQTASETEQRLVTEANEDLTIELPLATNSDHAKRVASMILYARWRQQNTRSLKVSRKYAFLSSGDGITVEYPRGTFRLWRVMSLTDTGALIEMNVEPGDAELFMQTAIGATGYVRQEVSPLEPPTNLVLLDVPILRDEDNNAGLYAAAEGYGSGWRGYTLWSGEDDASLQERGTVTTSVPLGFAESALGAWTLNMLDGMNSVVVNMGDDTISSTTEATLMTSRENLAFIGLDGRWEAIQFMTASSLGSGRYLIYGLLRGLYGTERFRGTHQAGDKFVLISRDGMLRPSMSAGSLGQEMRYRPVSLGRSFFSSASQAFTNQGVGLLPYSPWDARKSKAASNDQTITWERRSRLSTNSLRGMVPVGEASESYSVEFYTSSAFSTLAGTLTSTSKTLTITSAQQTAFGLTPGATLYVHIRQVSDFVGAGAPLEATL